MRAPVPALPDDAGEPSAWRAPARPFVLDVGANVGWFTLNAAAAGGQVAAFEGEPRPGDRGAGKRPGARTRTQPARLLRRRLPGAGAALCMLPHTTPVPHLSPPPAMPSNIALLRASLCASPWLMERVALYGTGLGTK
jgi:hypothetical protein